jgi:quinol-cytochrome oxidoreductase complex cytochrome b subunit
MRSLKNITYLNTVSRLVHSSLVYYPSPPQLTYMFSFGFLCGLFLTIQLITGIFLTMFYVPHVALAFDSIQFIMREVNYGFLLRYLHLSGASFFFLVIYIHMVKALFFSSFSVPRRGIWIVGCTIFFLLMGTAFLGYVLVWGQMSFWAATVITNLLTVIPLIGTNLTCWIWGGFAINESTLTRFFSIHFLLPFVISLLSVYHLFLLHKTHSSNPIGSYTPTYLLVRFYPYFYIKDFLIAMVILVVYFFIVCFNPEVLNHPDNYVPADALKTPASIVPEIYFLPFYGLLKCILNKSMGIAAMFLSILILFILPTRSPGSLKNMNYEMYYTLFFFLSNFIVLGIIGEQTPTTALLILGQLCSHLYFIYLLVFYSSTIFFPSVKPSTSSSFHN